MQGRAVTGNVDDGHFRHQGWIPGREVVSICSGDPLCRLLGLSTMFVVSRFRGPYGNSHRNSHIRARRKHNLWPLRRGRPVIPVRVLEQLRCTGFFAPMLFPMPEAPGGVTHAMYLLVGNGDVRLLSRVEMFFRESGAGDQHLCPARALERQTALKTKRDEMGKPWIESNHLALQLALLRDLGEGFFHVQHVYAMVWKAGLPRLMRQTRLRRVCEAGSPSIPRRLNACLSPLRPVTIDPTLLWSSRGKPLPCRARASGFWIGRSHIATAMLHVACPSTSCHQAFP